MFLFCPQNGIVYPAFPGIWFHAHHQKQDATFFWNAIPKPSFDFLCDNKLKIPVSENPLKFIIPLMLEKSFLFLTTNFYQTC